MHSTQRQAVQKRALIFSAALASARGSTERMSRRSDVFSFAALRYAASHAGDLPNLLQAELCESFG
jgi:hypothetical protein